MPFIGNTRSSRLKISRIDCCLKRPVHECQPLPVFCGAKVAHTEPRPVCQLLGLVDSVASFGVNFHCPKIATATGDSSVILHGENEPPIGELDTVKYFPFAKEIRKRVTTKNLLAKVISFPKVFRG